MRTKCTAENRKLEQMVRKVIGLGVPDGGVVKGNTVICDLVRYHIYHPLNRGIKNLLSEPGHWDEILRQMTHLERTVHFWLISDGVHLRLSGLSKLASLERPSLCRIKAVATDFPSAFTTEPGPRENRRRAVI